jgi:hypothetical protein
LASGNEDAVRKLIADAVRDHVDELRSDTISNYSPCAARGQGNGLR